MIKFSYLILLLNCFLSTSQINTSTIIIGEILVEGDELEGISIFNKTSNKGTSTNSNGKFEIEVTHKDILEIRTLKYQDFELEVTEKIITSKRLKIILIEEVTALEEVVITNPTFSGNLETDIKDIITYKPDLDAMYFSIKQELKINDENSDFIRNANAISEITSQNKPLVNGLNIVNLVDQLLLPLFRSEVSNKKKIGLSEVPPDKIKYYFGSEFLANNFNIPKHRVENFIRYVEDSNFDFSLLNYGRELEFLELLTKKSKSFLNQE